LFKALKFNAYVRSVINIRLHVALLNYCFKGKKKKKVNVKYKIKKQLSLHYTSRGLSDLRNG